MDEAKNILNLRGTAIAEPVFSHENHGQEFYRFSLSVRRLSGQEDILPVITTLEQIKPLLPLTGQRIALEGQLRSFNNRSGSGSRLVISVHPHIIIPTDEEDCNSIQLGGVICKPPILRRTPLGRYICDIMLAVNRRYGRADYLPCIAWGQIAMTIGSRNVGDTLFIDGRVQSRIYNKVIDGNTIERTAFEVSVMHLLDKTGTAE